MEPLSRLWFALPGGEGAGLERLVAALDRRSPARVVAADDEGSCQLAERLARGREGATLILAELAQGSVAGPEVLARLAAQHPDQEVVLVAPAPALEMALRVALGLDPRDPYTPIRPRPGALYAFDWPTGNVAWARPRLVGCDLDWMPPWRRGGRHPRYPGGPAAAGSSRT